MYSYVRILIDKQMVAKYKCEKCGKKWKSINSTGGSKRCLSCNDGSFTKPYKIRPIKDKVNDSIVCTYTHVHVFTPIL